MILLVDNHDSFTFNLVQSLGALGADVVVRRSDAVTVAQIAAMAPRGIVLSPGPGTPEEATLCLDVARSLSGRVPILGVCLGHQAIAVAFGGRVGRAPSPVHGRAGLVRHDATGLFAGLPDPLAMGRYHSLVVTEVPEPLVVTARSEDGLVMGLRHREHRTVSVQGHPESTLSPGGDALLANFLALCG